VALLDGLRADPLPWLPEEENPPVRYGALVDSPPAAAV